MEKGYADIVHNVYFAKDSIGFRIVVDSINLVGGFWVIPLHKKYLYASPEYAIQENFTEQEISLGDSLKLPGTLALPKGKGPFPAIVLVHGSGPNDRDETIVGNKPFRDLAWGLASRGVMVYRYEKRTKVFARSINVLKMTVQEEVIDDALAAVRMIRARRDVDTSKIILLGHSLGGMLVPEIAYSEPAIKGVVMLGAIARPLEGVAVEQLQFVASRQDTVTVKEQMKITAHIADAKQIIAEKFPENKIFMNAPASYYYDLHRRKPAEYVKKLDIPIFIAQGGKDYQAPIKDFEMFREMVKDKKNAELRLYQKCFHLFIEIDAEPGPWNYEYEGHVTVKLIDDLSKWIANAFH